MERSGKKFPDYHRLDTDLSEEVFPGTLALAFDVDPAHGDPAASHAELEPGRRGTYRLEYTPADGLPAGARVAFVKLTNTLNMGWRLQDYLPTGLNYVTAEDGSGNSLPLEAWTEYKPRGLAIVSLPHGLMANDSVTLRIGDRRQGGPGAVVQGATMDNARIVAGVALPGENEFRTAPEALVTVAVHPVPCIHRYSVFAPSTAVVGDRFRVVAMALDINGNSLPAGDVRISGRDIEVEHVAGTDLGSIHVVARPMSAGVLSLELTDSQNGLSARSNPIQVGAAAHRNIYWGEFHSHAYDGLEINELNRTTSPESLYRYGRDVTRLDFLALGSHIFRHDPSGPGKWWEMARAAASALHEDGSYIPFLGCEWRDAEARGGDRNLVYRDLDAAPPDPTWTVEEIFSNMRGTGLVTPHVGGTVAMPHHHDSAAEPLCEMTSGHGNFEWFAQAYLAKGWKLGLIGGSDGHVGTPGHPRRPSTQGSGRFWHQLRFRDVGWSGGPLMAVAADSLTRESLCEAFHARRTYASTGARALLEFGVDGHAMGASLAAHGPVTITLRIVGTAPVQRVDLIRGDRRLKRWEPGTTVFQAELDDLPTCGETYYYIRVEQEDGEMLWSSPVWVKSDCAGSDEGLPAWNQPEAIDLLDLPDLGAGEHLGDLLRYLRTEEDEQDFDRITPWKIVLSPMGPYAVFLGYFRGSRIRIHWFYDFELPRIRLEAGWVQYGRERVQGVQWPAAE